MKNNKELQRSADFSGETPRYPMDGNSNCTAWCRWETYRVYRDGQPGWDCRFIINATKTNPYATYGYGKVQAGTHGHEEGTLEEKYMEIVANQVRTFYDQAVFVKAEAGADITLSAYANIIIPNVVGKGMNFTINVKRNLWGVYFDANGGSGAPSMQKKYFNNTLYLTTQKPTRSGYTFKGWATSPSSSYAQYQPGDAFTIDADTTLYAVWGQNVTRTWSITYNANGGSNAPARQTANIGQSITITSSRPTRSGHTFLGWATWSSATYAEYLPGNSVTSDYDMTLYAVWKSSGGGGGGGAKYYLNFNLQGGSGTFNTIYGYSGERVRIPSDVPTKSGYRFLGWSKTSTGTPIYQPGEYYTLNSNTVFYAIWEEVQTQNYCTIYFNANGGSGAPSSQRKVVGEQTYIPYTTPTWSNHTFLGWSTSSWATSADYQPGSTYTPYGDMTFYAVWKQNVVRTWSIIYDANGGINAPAKQTANVGQSITITRNEPTRSGYTFLGWNSWSGATEPDPAYTPGNVHKSDYNMTLYAVWEEDKKMYLGYDRIRKIYIGNRQVTAAYLGTAKIW